MDKIKDYWQKLSDKTKRLLIIIVGATAAAVVAGIIILNATSTPTTYSPLFTSLSSEEAEQVGSLLQDQSVDYRYDAESGTIRVPSDQVDTLRANLLAQGYPKSGFAYDVYINNSGVMATESDKKQYTLYDLQDRLGATIRLFDGVQDAKVTIAEGSTSSYALDDDSDVDATASAVVTMKDGQTLSETTADAIRNLISRSVNGMNFTNVSVFDAGTMEEVGGGDDDSSSTSAVNEMETEVTKNIENKVRQVLGKLYGSENVAVSVKGVLDTTHSVTENIQYSVPAQTDEDDKTGLLQKETTSQEQSTNTTNPDGGIAGTDSNADTPYYTTDNGDGTTSSYSSSSTDRDYLFNQSTEQRETNPGTLQDLTVAVVINTNDTSIRNTDLVNLVADAAGIARDDATDKITIIRSPLVQSEETDTDREGTETQPINLVPRLSMLYLIAAMSAAALVVFLVILILAKKRAKRREQDEALAAMAADQAAEERNRAEEERRRMEQEAAEAAKRAGNEHVQRSMDLKDQIGSFVDENPQAAAKLVESWLTEDDTPSSRTQYQRSGR